MIKTFAAAALLSIAVFGSAGAAVRTDAAPASIEAPAAVEQFASRHKPNNSTIMPRPKLKGVADAGSDDEAPVQVACHTNTPTNPCTLGPRKPKPRPKLGSPR
ncbi:MAG: hypothetical protein ACRCTI_13075 [Beijerinckiaceae bacterium]